MKINFATITMDAGAGIEGSMLTELLRIAEENPCFSRVFVVDGAVNSSTHKIYQSFSKVFLISSPWKDDYKAQYEAFASKIPDGEWCLYLDDDELPSPELLKYLSSFNPDSKTNMFFVPCVLHLRDGANYFPAEPEPPQEPREGLWFKHILFKKLPSLAFRAFGSHVIPTLGAEEVWKYIPHPYFHMKTLESFVKNDVWQAFLMPEGQQYSAVHSALFKKGLQLTGVSTTKELKEKTITGRWHPVLQKFAWDNRWLTSNPVSRLAWTYFILYGHKPLADDPNLTWYNVKKHILSSETMRIFEKSIAEQRGYFK